MIISRIKLLTNLIIISIFARPQRHKHENFKSELQVHCKGTKIGQAHIEVKVLLDQLNLSSIVLIGNTLDKISRYCCRQHMEAVQMSHPV